MYLNWYVITFLTCLVTGLILCFGSVLTGPPEFPDPALHPDVDHDHHSEGSWIMFFGGGKIPIGLALAITLLGFGTIGIAGVILLDRIGLWSGWAVLIALLYLLTVNPQLCRVVGQIFPSYETNHVTPETFKGRSGVAITPILPGAGCVRVYDDQGNYHLLSAHTVGEEEVILKESLVLIVSYNEETHTYGVVRDLDN